MLRRAPEVDGDPWYFVMEYLGGGSLDALVDARERLEPPLAVEIAHQVCVALDHIHKAGFAHLDIKTNNVLFRQPLSDRGAPEAVLIDFGSAQKFLRQADVEQMTLVYAPPERVRIKKGAPPESFVDKPAADIYSLGITLYRMVAGRLPFTGSRSHVMTDILNTTPTQPQVYAPALRRLPELNDLIMAMLAKQPTDRPKAPDVVERLEKAIPSPRVWGGLPELPGPGKRDPRPWRGAFVGLALVAIMAAPAGYVVGRNGRLPDIPRPLPSPEALNMTPPITATSTLNPQAGAALRPTTPPLRTVTPPPATALEGAIATPSATTGHDTVTPVPAPTLTPVPTFTAAPIATSPPIPAPAPVVNPSPVAPIQAAVPPTLLAPANNETDRGGIEFRWQPTGSLPAGAGYEVVWWPENAAPSTARGFASPTTGTSLSVNLDGFFENTRTILWTVLVVDARPNNYKRLTQPSASNARRLMYQGQ